MKQVYINQFEKVGSNDENDLQLAVHQSLFDDTIYPFFGKINGVMDNSFLPTYVSALAATLDPGTGFIYDGAQVGFNPKYRMILAPGTIPVTFTAADGTHDRIDLVCLQPNFVVTAQANRYIKTGGVGPIALTTVNKNYSDSYSLVVVAGTPSASPAVPATPAGCIPIAQALIHQAVGLTGSGDITDVRTVLGVTTAASGVSFNPSGRTYATSSTTQGAINQLDTRLLQTGTRQTFVSSGVYVAASGITRVRVVSELHNSPSPVADTLGNALVLDRSGTIWVWGQGNLGNGVAQSQTSSPTAVVGSIIWRSLGIGWTAAIDQNANVWTWGVNDHGQLGIGTSGAGTTSSPTMVAGSTKFQTIIAGTNTMIGLDIQGRIWSWGSNAECSLGQGNGSVTFAVSSPVMVVASLPFTKLFLTGGDDYSQFYALDVNGGLWGWGDNLSTSAGALAGLLAVGSSLPMVSSPTLVVGGHSFVKVVGNSDSSNFASIAALDSQGNVYCWGENQKGQLGDGTVVEKSTPVLVLGGHTFTDIQSVAEVSSITGGITFFGLDTSGQIWSWGGNRNGVLGNGTANTPVSSPVLVVGGIKFMSLFKGSIKNDISRMGAIATDGTVYMWGDNLNGGIGNGVSPAVTASYSSPIAVAGSLKASALFTTAFPVAVATDGTIWAWGAGNSGRLGNSTNVAVSSPVMVLGGFSPNLDQRQSSREFEVIAGASYPVLVQCMPSLFAGQPIGSIGPGKITVVNQQ